MSYILDALRRADAERERGNVPGIHAQPTRIPPAAAAATAALAPWLRGSSAVAMLLLLAWLIWRAYGTETAAPASGDPAFAPALTAAASTLAPLAATPVAPVVPTGAFPPALPAIAVSPATTDTARARAPARAFPARTQAATAVPANRSSSSPATTDARPIDAPASAPGRVYAVDELPEEVRRELPKFAIGGSIYSASPASRFVIVNGQLVHEGDTLAPGLVLQQIKVKSAVLSFRGYRYAINL